MNRKILLFLIGLLTSCSTPVVEIPLVVFEEIPQGSRLVIVADKETTHSYTIANGLSTTKKILHDIKLKTNDKVQLKFDRESKDYLLALYVDPHGRLGDGWGHRALFRPCDVGRLGLIKQDKLGIVIGMSERSHSFIYRELYLKKKYRKTYNMWTKLEQQLHSEK